MTGGFFVVDKVESQLQAQDEDGQQIGNLAIRENKRIRMEFSQTETQPFCNQISYLNENIVDDQAVREPKTWRNEGNENEQKWQWFGTFGFEDNADLDEWTGEEGDVERGGEQAGDLDRILEIVRQIPEQEQRDEHDQVLFVDRVTLATHGVIVQIVEQEDCETEAVRIDDRVVVRQHSIIQP